MSGNYPPPTDWPAIILAIGTLIGAITAAGLSVYSAIQSSRAATSSKENTVQIDKINAQMTNDRDRLVNILDDTGAIKGIMRESELRRAWDIAREAGSREALKKVDGTPAAQVVKDVIVALDPLFQKTIEDILRRLPEHTLTDEEKGIKSKPMEPPAS